MALVEFQNSAGIGCRCRVVGHHQNRLAQLLIESVQKFKDFISDDGMRLSPVDVEGDHSISEILSFYMGKNTPDRREFIMDNLVVDAEAL